MFPRTSQPVKKNKSAPSARMRAGSSSACSLSRLSAPLMLHEMKGLCWSCSRTGIHCWSTRFIPAAQAQVPATHSAAPVGLHRIKSARDQKLRGFTVWFASRDLSLGQRGFKLSCRKRVNHGKTVQAPLWARYLMLAWEVNS